jgi:hypothetical protein
MSTRSELLGRTDFDLGAFLDLVAFRNQRLHIIEPRELLGDQAWAELLLWASDHGTLYIRYPTLPKAAQVRAELGLVRLQDALEAAKQESRACPGPQSLRKYVEAERAFNTHARRTIGNNLKKAAALARATRRELRRAKAWLQLSEKK